VRFWDHDLGPDQARLLVGNVPVDGHTDWQDLTPTPGNALRETSTAISPDGRTVVADWLVAEPHGASRSTLVAFDVASGARRTLLDDAEYEYERGRISPDGRTVAVTRTRRSSPSRPTIGPGAGALAGARPAS